MNQEDQFSGISFRSPGGYFVLNQDEVAFIDDKRSDADAPIKICAPLRVIAKTRDPRSGEWGRLLQWTDDDGISHQLVMAQSKLEGDGLEVRQELARGGLHIEQSKKARDLLAQYIKLYPVQERVRCVERLGWHGDVYVTASGSIGDSEEPVLYQGNTSADMAWTTQADVSQWRESVAALAQGNSRLMFAISAALAGPLLALSGESSGGFHFRGSSSSGKSTALKVASSVWGNPRQVMGLWRSTLNGLEGMAALHNDNVLILDELGQLDPFVAGESAYLLANERGKMRARRNGQAMEPQSWRLIFLSAGEEALSTLMAQAGKRTSVGQEIRLADIEADAGSGTGIVENLHGMADAKKLIDQIRSGCEQYYGAVGQAWLRQLVRQRHAIAACLHSDCLQLAEQWTPSGSSGQVGRVASRFALVAYAGELATEYGLSGWVPGEARQAVKQCFDAWLEAYGGGADQEDRRIVEQVVGFLEMHGAGRFQSLKGDPEPRLQNRVGYFRDVPDFGREYLVPAHAFKNELCRGLDLKRAKRVLIENEILWPGTEGVSQAIRVPDHGVCKLYVLRLPPAVAVSLGDPGMPGRVYREGIQ